jgi:hypothetical protein
MDVVSIKTITTEKLRTLITRLQNQHALILKKIDELEDSQKECETILIILNAELEERQTAQKQ